MKTNLIIVFVILAVLIVGGAIYLLPKIFYQPATTPGNNQGGASGTFPEGTGQQTHSIEISNFAFSPQTLTIQVGDTVTWTNNDLVSHKIVSDSGNELASSSFGKGETYSHTFNTVGTFDYHCSIHPSMKGTITVD